MDAIGSSLRVDYIRCYPVQNDLIAVWSPLHNGNVFWDLVLGEKVRGGRQVEGHPEGEEVAGREWECEKLLPVIVVVGRVRADRRRLGSGGVELS